MWKPIIDVFPVMMCFLLADNTVGTVYARIQKVLHKLKDSFLNMTNTQYLTW